MKRVAVLLLLSLVVGLTGCGQWVNNEARYVSPHVEQSLPQTPEEDADAPVVVTNRTELRGAVLSFIRDWTELGLIDVEDYDGDIAADLAETMDYATKSDPTGAYAVDYADAELTGDGRAGRIAVSLVFRRSAAEIDAIVTVTGNTAAEHRIEQALSSLDTALTLRIRNYRQADFATYIRNYCLTHPASVTALPEISVAVYPDKGATRIVEIHFGYAYTREEMRQMQQSVSTILASASSYIRSGATAEARVKLLYRFLTGRIAYTLSTETPVMPAYELLIDGTANSLSFASVFYSECQAADVDCWMVEGTLNGQAHYWNLVEIESGIWHVDPMRSLLKGELVPQLLTTSQLRSQGYAWDTTGYPASQELPETTEPPEETEPEPTEPDTQEPSTESVPPEESTAGPTEESTESTSSDIPTESGQESEPTEPTKSTEPTEPEEETEP